MLLTASDFCLKPMALSQPGPPLPHPNGGIEQLADIAKVARDKLQEDVKFINNKIQAVHIDMDWHWILGSCIALCAAVMANTGLNSAPAAARKLMSQSSIISVAVGSSMLSLAFSLYRVGVVVRLNFAGGVIGGARPPDPLP